MRLIFAGLLSILAATSLGCSVESDPPPGPAGAGSGGSAGSEGGAGSGASAGSDGTAGGSGASAGSDGTAGSAGGAGSDGGAGAGGTAGTAGAGASGGTGGALEPLVPLTEVEVEGSQCGAVKRSFEIQTSFHVPNCQALDYRTNPPSSGDHYGTWAAFRNYDNPVPRGFWVHSMEHGAVVVAYRCTDCQDEVEAAVEAIAEVGVDPLCCSDQNCATPVSRVILTPDPELETDWAAASWGYTLTADCFESEIFRDFIVERRGHGAEAVCNDGTDLSTPPC
jgi:hypothetical protein